MIAMETTIWVLLGAIHLAVVVHAILLEGRDPYSRAAWLLLQIALPGIAEVLYLLFGEPWISAKFRKRSGDAYEALLADVRSEEGEVVGAPESANAFRTCAAATRWPVSAGNRAKVAPEGDAAIDMVMTDIDAATRTMHLSFYIWLGDGNGTKVVEAVCRAARRGINCRIVADAIGSPHLVDHSRRDRCPCRHERPGRLRRQRGAGLIHPGPAGAARAAAPRPAPAHADRPVESADIESPMVESRATGSVWRASGTSYA